MDVVDANYKTLYAQKKSNSVYFSIDVPNNAPHHHLQHMTLSYRITQKICNHRPHRSDITIPDKSLPFPLVVEKIEKSKQTQDPSRHQHLTLTPVYIPLAGIYTIVTP